MSTEKRIRERAEIPETDTWAIEDLYPSAEAWEADHELVKKKIAEAASFQGRLGESASSLLAFADLSEQITRLMEDLYNYAQRLSDTDTRVPENQARMGRIVSTLVSAESATSFVTPELLAMDDETVRSFFAAEPGLEKYRRWLNSVLRMRPHTLSREEESLLAAAGEMAAAPDNVYGMFNNADLRFPDAVDSQGETHPLTHGTFISLMESPDRELRRSAFENLYHTYDAFGNTVAAVMQAEVKQRRFFAQARHFSSSLEASLFRTEVPVSVYANLIETVHANMDKMERYVALRKRLLGVESLHSYDLYTPLIPGSSENIPFEQAKQTVYDALACMGDEYRSILKEGFDHRWIDVYENAGKRSGAYSAGAMVHPYVLLNYSGTLDSQFTLAHEMGHAVHSYLSNKHQPVIDHDYVIFVAEVASTCNESLLMQHLLDRTEDKKERAALINHFLEQFRTILFRQTMFAEFEMIIGRLEQEGATLTRQLLNEEYGKLIRRYFGPDLALDPEIECEWMRIPHFYYNYYVFQYATGFSAAIALSRRILREGKPAVTDYLRFLSGGRSAAPIDLLKIAGVDMSTPAPIQNALDLFGELLDEMDELTRA